MTEQERTVRTAEAGEMMERRRGDVHLIRRLEPVVHVVPDETVRRLLRRCVWSQHRFREPRRARRIRTQRHVVRCALGRCCELGGGHVDHRAGEARERDLVEQEADLTVGTEIVAFVCGCAGRDRNALRADAGRAQCTDEPLRAVPQRDAEP